jgi:hypothetical protein
MHWLDDNNPANQREIGISLQERLHHLPDLCNRRHRLGLISLTMSG